MKEIFDDIRIYLPKYLSEEEQRNLFRELSFYPENINDRFYSNYLSNEQSLFQGDVISEVFFPDYKGNTFRPAKAFLISNTCDMDLSNSRTYTPFLMFSPIFSLKKYENILLSLHPEEKVIDHIDKIRKEKITTFFYLPGNENNLEECYVRLDNIFSLPLDQEIFENLIKKRLLSLSQYGFYLLLLKLSIHFTRVQEAVKRNN